MPAVPNAQRPQISSLEDNVQFFGQLQETLAKLERSQQELMQRLSQLETLNQELLETNQALFILTRRIEVVRQEAKEQIISQVKLLLFPFLERMRETQGEKSYEPQLRKLMQCIEHVDTVPPSSTSSIGTPAILTSQELRIASMIRRGMTNDDIAEQLHVAPTTVKTHRRNIRKKLGITGAKNRLYTYFQTPEPLHAEPPPPRSPSVGQQGESHRPVVIPLYPDRSLSLSSKDLHTLSQGDL
jgi:ATP/maltotriose-dependent transcriptional regulator MalT